MEWVRGGRWQLEFGSAVAEQPCAVLSVNQEAGLPRSERLLRPTLFFTEQQSWREHIGEPAGLECYTVSTRTVSRLMGDASALIERFPTAGSRPLEDQLDLGQGLLNLLEQHGPLSGVDGILVVPGAPLDTPSIVHGRVPIQELILELRSLVGWSALLASPLRESRKAVGHKLIAAAEVALREVDTKPEVFEGKILFSSRPITLRAFIWGWLFGRLAPGLLTCAECPRLIPTENKPGPRPKYCKVHGSNAGRQARFRKKMVGGQLGTPREMQGLHGSGGTV